MSITTRRARVPWPRRCASESPSVLSVQLGRWHDVPVGPHTAAMYQVAFATELFARSCPG